MVGAASSVRDGIERVLAGVFVLRDVGGDEVDRIARQALARYRGPDLGGVDLMQPGPTREAWLMMGRSVRTARRRSMQAARLRRWKALTA